MTKDSVIEFKKPDAFVDDLVSDVLRTGARKLLAEALETEAYCSRKRWFLAVLSG
ncbi:MAG: hypothetical protein SV775_14035 [Thermodesulfobacteriota bacterium]|nr:hypothetical protein [Thermodesulfobacteriota bacterium]